MSGDRGVPKPDEGCKLAWARLPGRELLEIRVKDLGLKIQGTYIEKRAAQLYRNLDRKGITFHPPCYLSDDWFCPDGVPAIGIPFFLAHPRLRKLERKQMLDVEGGNRDQFFRILRHECGHALNYAYLLHKKTRWRKLFGSMSADYNDVYRVRPYSRKYVRNIDNWYAQMHPDEDFAETFAVWLAPGRDWRKDYEGWGALEKLEYVDELIRNEVAGWQPKVEAKRKDFLWSAERMTTTLGAYYKKRRAEYAWDYTDFYDSDLMRLFSRTEDPDAERASHFLARRREDFLENISRWSKESKFNINRLLRELTERCEELDLRVAEPETETVLAVTAWLTSLAVNYRLTGEYKRQR